MSVQVLLCVVGLVVLALAADQLVLGAARLAARLRLNPVAVGVVVIGLGTSMPEFLVSGVAAARGDAGIAIGNLVGSNILNLTVILGVAGLIAPVAVASSVVRREIPLAVAAMAAFGVIAWWRLDPATAVILLVFLAGALVLLVRWTSRGRNRGLASEVKTFTDAPASPWVWVEGVRAVGGLVGVLAGAQLLVVNAARIAERFGVPQLVMGVTLVALGTSLPELVTVVQAQRRRQSDLVVGNLFGSNLFNALAGGAVVGFASGAARPARAAVMLCVAMVLAGVLAWILLRRGLRLGRGEALLLVAAYLVTLPLLLSI